MTTEDEARERLTLENMRIFSVNDCDWVAAPSAEAAVSWYVRETVTEQFGSYEEAIGDVRECDLDTECWKEMGNPEAGRTTYRALIEYYLSCGNTKPFVCASTEY